MTLCWSLDKLGPMTRSVEDAMLVLHAITGPDAGDLDSVPSKLDFDADASVHGLRVGYFPAWMKGRGATDVDRAGARHRKKVRHDPSRSFAFPIGPTTRWNLILFAEAGGRVRRNHARSRN